MSHSDIAPRYIESALETSMDTDLVSPSHMLEQHKSMLLTELLQSSYLQDLTSIPNEVEDIIHYNAHDTAETSSTIDEGTIHTVDLEDDFGRDEHILVTQPTELLRHKKNIEHLHTKRTLTDGSNIPSGAKHVTLFTPPRKVRKRHSSKQNLQNFENTNNNIEIVPVLAASHKNNIIDTRYDQYEVCSSSALSGNGIGISYIEVVILTTFFTLWIFAIGLFIRKWRDLRLLEPRENAFNRKKPKNLDTIKVVEKPADSVIYNVYSEPMTRNMALREMRLKRMHTLPAIKFDPEQKSPARVIKSDIDISRPIKVVIQEPELIPLKTNVEKPEILFIDQDDSIL